MDKFIIQGGRSLKGVVSVSGNKNEALPAIAASLLTDDPVILRNVPRIGDVSIMLDIMASLGVRICDIGANDIEICCREIRSAELDESKCAILRAALLFAGPLLTRFEQVFLPPPGGDVIGRRRMDAHFCALKRLGATVTEQDQKFAFSRTGLVGCDIFMEEQSVTATENALMAAALAEGRTVLRNAACEPHVTGLGKMLRSMGANIKGLATNIVEIEGVSSLSGTEHTIGPDYLEIGGYIILAVVTDSELNIRPVAAEDLSMIRLVLRRLNIEFEIRGDEVHVPDGQKLEVRPDFAGDIPKIDDGPWPAFPTDMMSFLIVAATQASGTVLIFEKMYDGRMFFVDSLISMGARIVLCDPHRVVVVGPSQLYGTQVQSPDIRAGMALVIAALCARGESLIYNIRQIDRGYENLEGKLQSLGAEIRRIEK